MTRPWKSRVIAAVLTFAFAAPSFAADNFAVKDANSVTITKRAFDIGSGIEADANILLDNTNTRINPATKDEQTLLRTALGSPFQAGGSIGNTTFGATQSGTWNVGLTGNLPAFASPPTFNLGTLNGAATAVKQPALGAAGTPSSDVITVQGISGGTPQPTVLTSGVAKVGQVAIDQTTPGVTNKVTLGGDLIQADVRTDTTFSSALNSTSTVSPNNGQDTWAFYLSGTAGGIVLQPQISFDGANFTNTSAIALAGTGSANAATITADGRYRVKAGGARSVRLLVTTAGTGTVAISSNLSVAPYDALPPALDSNRDLRVPTVTVSAFYVSLAAATSTEVLAASTTRNGFDIQCTGTADVGLSRVHATLTKAAPDTTSSGNVDVVVPAGTKPLFIPAYVSGSGVTAYTATAQACWGVSYARQ